jgi:purine-binding chemotaxis protein CheW
MHAGDAPETASVVAGASAPLWLVFVCDDNAFAVRLAAVREIVPPQRCTRLPGCGPAVCGLVGLRGRVITVFDLGAALGLRPAAEVADHRLLLMDHGATVIGFAVDAVVAARPLEPDAPAHDDGAARAFPDALGVAEVDGARIVALDTDRILGRLLA